MKIKTVWAVYFSGTGTTGKIVTTIAATAAEQLHAPCNTLDFTLPAPREHSYYSGKRQRGATERKDRVFR